MWRHVRRQLCVDHHLTVVRLVRELAEPLVASSEILHRALQQLQQFPTVH